MKILDDNGLLYTIQKIKTLLSNGLGGKVDKVTGKNLSANDYTNEDKTKLSGIETGAEVNAIETVKVNGIALTPTSKAVNITVPTNNNQLSNEAGYQTEAQVNTLIANGIADIQGITYSLVSSLPATGEAGVIYLVANNGSTPNIYDEYIFVNGGFEKIGTTDIDLSGYVQDSDLVVITNAEIDAMCV